MGDPETEVIVSGEENAIHLNRIVPIYPLTEGLPQRWLRALVWRALTDFQDHIPNPYPMPRLSDLPTRSQAIHMVHFPDELNEAEAGRQRLALDEFLEFQLSIRHRRQKLLSNARGLPCPGDNRFVKPFLAQLGFKLTGAQTKVLREIRHDLASGLPMRRLLQGDVGSGKTAVAAASTLIVLESGFNVALMAPTEILAQQHFQNFIRWFHPLGIDVHLHTGSHKSRRVSGPKSNIEAQDGLALTTVVPRPATLTIGTHALIQSEFALENLGLVIIDEQHKFGVVQREQLVRKGNYPHLLVMTATPIPRTLGLTLYGDLDMSIIDEMPPGRGQIRTFIRASDKLPKVWNFIQERLTEGRQAYVVYPRVDDSGLGDLKAVTEDFERLQRKLAPHRVGLVHGRLRMEERDGVMAGFRRGEVKVLLATSVVEVGVDVPNATMMLVENADRFGLAQLHQLRGRIGRGAHESYCILVAEAKTPEASQRLQVLAETTNGFKIAEADLKLRGAGDLLGQEQSGLPPFRFGNLATDVKLVERARTLAAEIVTGR